MMKFNSLFLKAIAATVIAVSIYGIHSVSNAYVGKQSLSPEVFQMFNSITADSLSTPERTTKLKESITIERGEISNPFPEVSEKEIIEDTPEENPDPMTEPEIGLVISMKEPDNTKLENMQSAYEAMNAGQVESAVVYYKRILSKSPDDEQAKFGLATAYHRTGQLEQARDLYIELIQKNPNNWSALNNFFIIAGEESPKDALRQLRDLQRSNPEFSPIPAQMAMIYLKMDKKENAARYLGKALSISPENQEYRYNLAILLDDIGEGEIAAKLYKQLLNAAARGVNIPETTFRIRDRLNTILSENG